MRMSVVPAIAVMVLGGCFGQNTNPNPGPGPGPDPFEPDAGVEPDAPPDAVPLPPAEMAIVTPTTGTSITDHAPVSIQVTVRYVAVDALAVVVDGTVTTSGITVTPTPDGHLCLDVCTYDISWTALDVTEGSHAITVQAFRNGATKAQAALDLTFDDTPSILNIDPEIDEDLIGVGSVDVTISLLERGTATVALAIDGVPFDTKSSTECRNGGCTFVFPWNTETLAAGQHTLKFTITDGNGHSVIDTRKARFDDLVRVTSMHMGPGFVDEAGTLEMEVYVFDDTTNALLGCVGSANGMGPVNDPDIRYAIDAQLINTSGAKLRAADLAAKKLRFEVWEDDDSPVCPTPINPSGNDFAGSAPVKTRAQWEAAPVAATFGMVTEMVVLFDRPLTR